MSYFKKYQNVGDLAVVPVVTADPITSLIATGIASGFKSLFLSLQHPAADARAVINAVKQQIASQDARTRLATVIAGSQQNFKAADVDVNEMLFWYRQNYPNDYMQLLPEDKMYFNKYLDDYRQRFLLQRPDLQQNYLNKSYFNNDQINYKPETPGTQKAGLNMWVTLGIVGAGIYLLTKKKK
jgi:hypothetical protein